MLRNFGPCFSSVCIEDFFSVPTRGTSCSSVLELSASGLNPASVFSELKNAVETCPCPFLWLALRTSTRCSLDQLMQPCDKNAARVMYPRLVARARPDLLRNASWHLENSCRAAHARGKDSHCQRACAELHNHIIALFSRDLLVESRNPSWKPSWPSRYSCRPFPK